MDRVTTTLALAMLACTLGIGGFDTDDTSGGDSTETTAGIGASMSTTVSDDGATVSPAERQGRR